MPSEALAGVFRSLRLYHGPDAPRAAMDALYQQFIKPGDLTFDVGAHAGDRISSFRRLGARVIALEPQPKMLRALRLIHGHDDKVRILPSAASSALGWVTLHVNSANPTVSTASRAFIADADGKAGWEGQTWDSEIRVPAVTLDRLIAAHGIPAFIKIDVEGYEDQVLAGLNTAVPALSFEFTTIARDVALRSLARLGSLGRYEFNVSFGENHTLTLARWMNEKEASEFILNVSHEENSGDFYARLPGLGYTGP